MAELFNRLREAEMNIASSGPTVRQQFHDSIDRITKKLDRLNRFFEISTSRPVLIVLSVILGMVVVGSVLDVMYRSETLIKIYHVVKG
jgi:hypothetical protein